MLKKFLYENKNRLLPGSFLAILAGMALVWMGLHQTVTIVIDDQPEAVRTAALTVGGVLRAAGVAIDEADRVVPETPSVIWNLPSIEVVSAWDVLVITPDGEEQLFSPEKIPSNLLAAAGIQLFPQDAVLVNGRRIDPNQVLDQHGPLLLQVDPALPINITVGEREWTIYTHQGILGEALEAAGLMGSPQDRVSVDLMTPVKAGMEVTLEPARPVTVRMGETTLAGKTAATTVGEALLDLGLSMQHLDFSRPGEDEPVPENGEIYLVRVEENIFLMTDEVGYSNETVIDPETPLDEVVVIEPGQLGIFASRERVRYVDGEEVWREEGEAWQASEPRDGVLGLGDKAVVRTAVVDGQEIEYWRKISVYATWYSPCNCATPDGSCCFGSASGMPSGRGNIAVTLNWFRMMRMQPVFVQGYGRGFIGNVGGGGSYFNHYWIDLGYDDDNTPSSSMGWTTMYFLTPVPEWYPTILPWP